MERLLKGFPSHLAQTDGCLPSAPAAVPEPPCANPGKALRSQAALLDRIAAPWATVAVEVQDALPSLEFGAEILERITVNLVLNAAEALRKSWNAPNPLHSELSGGRIVVSLRMAAGRLRLMVEDNGPGMPPSIAAAFLRPTPLPAGTARGLGHRIVHELATATGGHLSIRVRPGAGTAFCLEWPINPGSLAASSIPRPRAATGPQRVPAALVGQIRQGIHRTANGGREAC
jgi:signal transduction histidine kinase